MKKSLILVGLLSIEYAQAQEGRVGINTETPKATLDVKSIDTDEAKGILTPQLTGDELKTMTASLTEDQNGLIVFAKNGVTTPDASTNNVQFVGYHRFNIDGNNKSWVRLEPSGLEKIKGDGNNTGWALIGRDASKYGRIGLKSVDISAVNSDAKAGVVMGATGNHSFATGLNTSASGWNSTTMGNGTIASGSSSIAMGSGALAEGNYSLAAGIGSQAKGWNSIAMGNKAVASGGNSISLGTNTLASNSYSFALGNQTQSTGWASTAMGNSAVASGSVAVALGSGNVAEGNYSFAVGHNSKANGLASIAIGFSTVAKHEQEIAMGIYNTEQTAVDTLPSWGFRRVLVVGNGSGNYNDVAQERSDAFTILKNGRIGIDIDNFETTTSDAKLQVNGKILANSLAGAGDRPVYADENGVLKVGVAPANVAPAETITASNGLTKTGSEVKLGGSLSEATTIEQGDKNLTISNTGTGVFEVQGTSKHNGAHYVKVTKVTEASYTAKADDYFITVDGHTSEVIIKIPNASDAVGRVFIISNKTSSTVAIQDATGTQAIMGSQSPGIAKNFAMTIASDGTKWYGLINY